jgi:hypothetical protein
MSAPTIITTTSVLEFEQYEYWQYQPVALGTNVRWTIDPIAPPGVEFDGTFGTLFGAVTRQGVYQVVLRAENDFGASEQLILTIGIRSAPQRRRTWAVDVDIDVVTRRAVIAGSPQAGGGTGATTYQQAIKYRDNLLYHVRFFKGPTRLDLGITKLAWSLKRTAEGRVLTSGETWRKIGFGVDATYALHIDLSDPRLGSELRSIEVGENDAQASFVGLGEFEWLQTNDDYDAVGPANVRGSSQGMLVLVVADQNQITPPTV